jgi:hypothetical protein
LLAALAHTHGCQIATTDRGFARFPGVHSFDPAFPRLKGQRMSIQSQTHD